MSVLHNGSGTNHKNSASASACGEDGGADTDEGYKQILPAIENIKRHFEKNFFQVLTTINELKDHIKLAETEQLSHAES